ncbi:hypothetical protein BC827DRAFT_1157866 [Russula dissimulans]|nr:hypothetical protein BC827DRAFT_1157866 [Russula dissimulans]
MPKRKSAARASIRNLREANKKRQKKVPSITTSEFPEKETGDTLDLDLDLDPDLREWCERQDISMGQVVDKDGNDTNSDLSSSEDCRCLDSFKEITEPSELKVFSIFLKKAQGVASEVQNTGTLQRTYKGNSRSTKYCHKKFHNDLISKGFLPLDQFMEQMKKKKLTISDSEPPLSHNTALQEEEEESDPGSQELPSPLVFKGPVKSGFWTILGLTITVTGLDYCQNLFRLIVRLRPVKTGLNCKSSKSVKK